MYVSGGYFFCFGPNTRRRELSPFEDEKKEEVRVVACAPELRASRGLARFGHPFLRQFAERTVEMEKGQQGAPPKIGLGFGVARGSF